MCPSFSLPPLLRLVVWVVLVLVGWRGAPLLPFWHSSLGVEWVVGP